MLARYLGNYRDELEADFRQFYGLDLNDLGRSFSLRHAAVLAAQLPVEARVTRNIEPNLSWSPETWLLRRIEHLFSLYLYSQNKNRGQKPKPVDTPAESKDVLKSLEKTDFDYIAEKLGVRNG